jgi:hypothetical protein|tara:strand:- start:316 stop:603 length:288 start_codon:yes stop_codon:yes gene_type:complete
VFKTEIEELKKQMDQLDIDYQNENAKVANEIAEAKISMDCVVVKDIQEIKSLSNPPKEVANLMELIQMVFGENDPNWSKAKKLLANPNGFIHNLK